ncbi:MAG: hypothetical protein Q7K55_02330 [Candidatus Levybacteria bacterium]|nr:hypothetical protein [Candidatus Levybacteria bacterium]
MFYKKLIPIIVFTIVFLFYSKSAFASTLYLSPAGGNIGTGNVMYVQIRLNASGDSVNGVSAYLSYPSDKIEVVSMSYGGSFGIAAEGSYGGGGVRISRGNISGVGGDVNIATMGVRGKTPGSATISFIGGSAAPRASDSSDSLSGTRGGTYTVIQGAVQSKTPSGSGTQLKATPTPIDTTKPQMTDIKTTLVTTNSATINWKTNEKTDSYIEYGLENNKYFLSATSAGFTTGHSLKIENPVLTPGAKIHFRITAKDEAGNITNGNDMSFQLLGFTVKIKVVDQNQKPVENAEVILYSDPIKSITDKQGVATFNNTTLGKHLIVTKINGAEKTQEIDVKDLTTVQTFNVIVDIKTSNSIFIHILSVLALALIAGAIIIIKKRKMKSKENTAPTTQNNQNPQNITPPQNQPQ